MLIDNLQGKKHVTNKKTTYISFFFKTHNFPNIKIKIKIVILIKLCTDYNVYNNYNIFVITNN
jgi:hypothetical protein